MSTIPDNTPQTSPDQPTSYMPGATPPVSPAPGPTKRSHTGLIVASIVAGVLVVIAATAAATVALTSSGKPAASSSTYKPIYDNGAAPVAPATTEPSYPNPTDADFKLTPKITQKQCFGSAGCNVTFTVDLAYIGKGAKPNSTWDITYDGVGTDDALTDTITLHFDGTGAHGTYDSKEERVQTKNSSDAITLRITNISPGIG